MKKLIRFLELIKLRGDIEFLGGCEISFGKNKVECSYKYKNILKVYAVLSENYKIKGNLYLVDIKQFIKVLKSFKNDLKLTLDKNKLLCYNSNQQLEIENLNKELLLYPQIEIEEDFGWSIDFSKEIIKDIKYVADLSESDEFLIYNSEGRFFFKSKDQETKFKSFCDENFRLKVSKDFVDILKTINDDCQIKFADDRVIIKYKNDFLEINYVLMGLEGE